jgi:hypothetical protein
MGTHWHTKSDTIVLAVLVALTLKVKMNCIAILALLCCTWWLRCVVDCGGLSRMDESSGTGTGTGTPMDTQRGITTVIRAIQRFWRFQLHWLWNSQDELHCNFDPALLYLMTSMRGGLWWIVAYERVTWDWNWNADGHTKRNNYCDQSNTQFWQFQFHWLWKPT